MANETLGKAKAAKNDEFYTQYADIEKEMNAYLEFNPDVFRDKAILLPCDDPEWSNFTKYFAQRFEDLGLKKLISTSYAPNSKPQEIPYQPALFELNSPDFDEEKTYENGKIFTLTRDTTGDKVINVDDLEWSYLEGDGDFRSDEITALRDEADVVITNPPFSLWRTFLQWLVEGGVEFSVIGNTNAITYKEVFPFIKDNRFWLGATGNGSDMVFRVPEGFEVSENDREKAAKAGYVGDYTRLGNSSWFSTIEHGRRHQPLSLMTMEENIRFNRAVKDVGYQKYDNYDAIEVPRTDAIPSDYDGVMGVPISFLDKYNPDQFEILFKTERDNPERTQIYSKDTHKNANDLNRGPTVLVDGKPTNLYQRIMIRHKKVTE